MKKNKQMQIEELLTCQLENINIVEQLLEVMQVQKKLLCKLNKKSEKGKACNSWLQAK